MNHSEPAIPDFLLGLAEPEDQADFDAPEASTNTHSREINTHSRFSQGEAEGEAQGRYTGGRGAGSRGTGSSRAGSRDTGSRGTGSSRAGSRRAAKDRSSGKKSPQELREARAAERARQAEAALEADPEGVARDIALRQLTAGPRTRHQLAEKMAARDVPEDSAQKILDRFEELKLINDAEFAHMWVRSRSEYQHLGAAVLRRELVLKGVAEEHIEAALATVDQDQHLESAQALVARKVRNLRAEDLSERKERDKVVRRLVGMLVRKGHAPGTAFTVVNEALEQIGESADADGFGIDE